jgi:hypothetical protein
VLRFRFLESQLDGDAQWRLADWCRERGADAFTVEVGPAYFRPGPERGAGDYDTADAEVAVRRALAGVPGAAAPMAGGAGEAGAAPAWRLTPEALGTLRRLWPRGPLASYGRLPAGVPWVPTLTLYRGEAVMLAYEGSEGEAWLWVPPADAAHLAALALPHRAAGESAAGDDEEEDGDEDG